MPQGRIILKSISESKKIASLKTDGARLLYTWLITHLDINGCFSGDPKVVKGKVFPRLKQTDKIIESYLQDLESLGLIIRYEANGDLFLIVPDFKKRQPNLRSDRESPGTIPLPTEPKKEYFKKATIPIDLVRQVNKRDGKVCQICGKEGVEDIHFKHYVIEKEKDKSGRDIAFEIDHIIPEYLGGETVLDNLRLVCRKCNRHKGIKTTPAELQRNSGTSKVKLSKVKLSKVKRSTPQKQYLDHVFLSDQEYTKLVERYGEKETTRWIEKLDSGIGSKGYKYKSHYKTIISWSLKDERNGNAKSKTQRTITERDFSKQESQYGQTIDV